MAAYDARFRRHAALWLDRYGRRPLRELDEWSVPVWIDEDFARRHDLWARAAEAASRTPRRAGTATMSLALEGIDRRVGDPHRWVLSAPRGIAQSHPFLDPRVISFALSLQERYRPDPHQIKPVLAAAMRGILPEEIRTPRDKRSFNELHYIGLSRNLGKLRRLIETTSGDAYGIFDAGALAQSIEEGALGIADTHRLWRLNVTLSLLVWLSKEAEWQRRPIAWSHAVRVPAPSGPV